MTPTARVQTAIECLDRIIAGDPAERVLTRWARESRHAGSKDRAAVRDLVFDVLRRWWSSAARGGGESGRARMIGYLSETGAELDALFNGTGYGPSALTADERRTREEPSGLSALDCPPALAPMLRDSLGPDFAPVMNALRYRAPVFLRVNLRRCARAEARAALTEDGITAVDEDLSSTALKVVENPRRVAQSSAFTDGLVEMQDAASQALVDALPLDGCDRILDFCAGGGGKTLAMADRHSALYFAHDGVANRMSDLPARAARAGQSVKLAEGGDLFQVGPFDLVLVDAPCSGSGAWRRSPEGKVRAATEDLNQVMDLQARILHTAMGHVASGGVLAYATCSLLSCENVGQVDRFLAEDPGFTLQFTRCWTPLDGADGFFLAVMRKT